jgi:hypothetical protein
MSIKETARFDEQFDKPMVRRNYTMLISVRDNDCKSKFKETKIQTNLTTNSSRFETLNTPHREPAY